MKSMRTVVYRVRRSGFGSMIVLVAIAMISISLALAVGTLAQRQRIHRSAHHRFQAESMWRIAASMVKTEQPTEAVEWNLTPERETARGINWIARATPINSNDYRVVASIQQGDRQLVTINRTIKQERTMNNYVKRHHLSAFTFVELLVVIAIIGILVGMLFPALQGMRESARQSQCQFRLQNLYLAMSEYHVAHNSFPPGTLNPTSLVESNEQGYHHNWIEHGLPYLDLAVYFKKIDWDQSVYEGVNDTLRHESFAQLRCPSSNPIVPFGSNYAGSHHPTESPIAEDNLGVLFLNTEIVPEVDIPDGLQATLLIGEKLILAGDLGWNSGTRATLRNVGTPFQTGYDSTKPVAVRPDSFVGPFGSAHPSGVLLVSCAGQAKVYDRNTDEVVLRQIADRRDIAETPSP